MLVTTVAVLLTVVSGFLLWRVSQMQSQVSSMRARLKDRERKIQGLTIFDELTGLYNRRYVTELASQEVRRCIRYRQSLSLLVLDIDKLRRVNATHGREAGDQVLNTVASAMRDCFRETDIFGRYGDDDFVAILPETPLETAVQAARRLMEDLAEREIRFNESPLIYSVSVGVADFTQKDESFDDLFRGAEKALYKSKLKGRNAITSVNEC